MVDKITLLAQAMTGTTVTELELRDGDTVLRLRRQVPRATPDQLIGATDSTSRPAAPPSASEESAEVTVGVMAPLTGVYYASPSPASPPFVRPGDGVQAGQVVCIIEAMKVFNEIKTEIGGTIVAIPPKSGQLVRKGDPLVHIRPF